MKKIILLLLLIASPLVAEEEEKTKEKLTEELVETSGTVRIQGKTIPYQAKTGTLILKDDEGNDKASVFYTAYTREDTPDKEKRPITFCFNGGPGSSALWLHIGVFGPKRVALTDDSQAKPPYRLIPNDHSILDLTDLVFIDPVSTGHSRPAPGEDAKQFHGVEEDIQSVGEFIRLYTTRNNRWDSPKYLAGESYGTTRAAGLSEYLLETERMYVDGLILISSILNFQTVFDNDGGNDLPYLLILPSYTAAAWYHQKLPADLQQQPLDKLLPQAEAFASNEYALALFQGDNLSGAQKVETLQKLSRFTGLSPEYLDRANLRVGVLRYAKELLRDNKITVGRFDSRITGLDSKPCAEKIQCDPSLDSIIGGFTATFNQYLATELKWEKDQPYKILANVWPWNFGKATNQYLNVADSLKATLTRNPNLRVFVASGRYDLATPYYATEYTLDHLGLPPSLKPNIQLHTYDAGHMMYTHPASLEKLRRDLSRFYQE